MISIDEALDLVYGQGFTPRTEKVALSEAVGRVLSSQIRSPHDLPFFDNSAMDGYAIKGNGPDFEIVGELAAGSGWEDSLRNGEALRIFTGAFVPKEAEAVIPQEKVTVSGTTLHLTESPKPGANIRPKGEELRKGAVVFEPHHVLNPAGVGLLASLGVEEVEVIARPRVSLLITGNELVKQGNILNEGQIYESNSVTLSAALSQSDLKLTVILKVKDTFEDTASAIRELLSLSDVILVSGGISVGDYDFVKKALEGNGVQEIFYKVDQKPGKPLFFGRKEDCFVFALPGNPASALTCYYLYARLLLDKLQGLPKRHPEIKKLSNPLVIKGDRPVILRGLVEGDFVKVLGFQSSSMLHSFGFANALIMPSGENAMEAGEMVRVVRI